MIKDRYRISCLSALVSLGSTYTYVVKNHIQSKTGRTIKTNHILINLKQLKKDGYVTCEKGGLGWHWRLTKEGRELISRK